MLCTQTLIFLYFFLSSLCRTHPLFPIVYIHHNSYHIPLSVIPRLRWTTLFIIMNNYLHYLELPLPWHLGTSYLNISPLYQDWELPLPWHLDQISTGYGPLVTQVTAGTDLILSHHTRSLGHILNMFLIKELLRFFVPCVNLTKHHYVSYPQSWFTYLAHYDILHQWWNTTPFYLPDLKQHPLFRRKAKQRKGNYQQWYKDMLIHLMGNCLFDYVEGDDFIPSTTNEPWAHKNWLANDCQAWSIIARSVDTSECTYIKQTNGSPLTVKKAWDSLKLRHENEGPIHQVNLLQKALATTCTRDTPLPETACQICKDIKCAFTIGTLNKDLLCCIALMNVLKNFPHLCTGISTSLTSYKQGSYTLENILLLLENKQGLHDADLMKKNQNNYSTIESTILAAQTQP